MKVDSQPSDERVVGSSLKPSNQKPAARKQDIRIARNASEIVEGRKKRGGTAESAKQ